MNFKLNFLGLTVADFGSSYRFYTEILGIEVKHSKPDWTAFKTRGMKFELFKGGASSAADRSWGHGQAIRPSFQVADLRTTISELRVKGVTFLGDIQKTTWGEIVEFIAPEGIHWTLAHASDYPFGTSLFNPRLGWVEMKTQNLSGQRVFYNGVMGLQLKVADKDQVIFRRKLGEPLLFLESGGQPSGTAQGRQRDPIFIGFETGDIKQAEIQLKSQGVSFLTVTARHKWGRDLFIKDPDGNSIQVVQYLR